MPICVCAHCIGLTRLSDLFGISHDADQSMYIVHGHAMKLGSSEMSD